MDPCPGAGKVARRQRVRNLTTALLRRAALGALTLSLLALAACAHSPPRARESLPQQAPVAVVAPTAATDASTPAPVASTPALTPQPAMPEPPAAVTAAEGPTQVAGLTPAQYGDLFDRMRAGFKLEDGADQRAVDQQLRWYASNPDYLQRAFGRADLYLYQ